MLLAEDIFLVARLLIAVLCVFALVAAVRRWGSATAGMPQHRPLLVMLITVLIIGIGLVIYDGWDNAVSRREQPLLLGSWLWLSFDAAVPLLAILSLRALEERDEAMRRLAEAAVTDPLTGLANRRGFREAALRALEECRRRDRPAAVLMFDIDRFKSVNDGHGHAAGDAVLQGMGAALHRAVRASDLVGRLGGEEFVVLCPGLDPTGAARVAERVRETLRAEVPHPAGGEAVITASVGVARVRAGILATALEAAIDAADRALYAAKEGGRDRVALAAD